MSPKKVISLIIAFIIILALLFVVSKFMKSDENTGEVMEDTQEEVVESFPIKHQYKDGEHIFVGTIETPTPCHSFNAEIIEREGANPLISITTSAPESDVICAQVIAERTFKVTYTGPEDLTFDAELNGQKLDLNIFEIDPSEDIDTFELFIKG